MQIQKVSLECTMTKRKKLCTRFDKAIDSFMYKGKVELMNAKRTSKIAKDLSFKDDR